MIKTVVTQPYSDQKIDELAAFLKLMSETNRLKIVRALQEGELSVGDIADKISQPINLVSFHLKELKKAGILTSRKKGLFVTYTIDEEKICNQRTIINYFLCERCALEDSTVCVTEETYDSESS